MKPIRVERDEQGRRRVVVDTLVAIGVALTISLSANIIFGVGAALDLIGRNERRGELNELACALRADASNTAAVASERGLAGDPAIVSSKSGLAAAALAVAGTCPVLPTETPDRGANP